MDEPNIGTLPLTKSSQSEAFTNHSQESPKQSNGPTQPASADVKLKRQVSADVGNSASSSKEKKSGNNKSTNGKGKFARNLHHLGLTEKSLIT